MFINNDILKKMINCKIIVRIDENNIFEAVKNKAINWI